MILYITLLVYGVMTMRSVLEEKTTRIVEILASSIKPFHLLTGKILGVAGGGIDAVPHLGVYRRARLRLRRRGGLGVLARSGSAQDSICPPRIWSIRSSSFWPDISSMPRFMRP